MESLCDLPIEELLSLCVTSGDAGAWGEFVRRYQKVIARVALRIARQYDVVSTGLIDDLVQETYVRLCAKNFRSLRNFVHKNPEALTGYIKVVSANVVRDHFKSAFSKRRGSGPAAQFADGFDPGLDEEATGSARALERRVLLDEIQGHLAICLSGPDQRRNANVFWLYYRVGLSAPAIAALPGIGLTTKGVESVVLRITKQLREHIAKSRCGVSSVEDGAGKGILPAESF